MYARAIQKKLWKLCGVRSTPKRCICCESLLDIVDESAAYTASNSPSDDAEHWCSGKEERKKSLSLGPIALPSALEAALDKAISSKSFSCVHIACCLN